MELLHGQRTEIVNLRAAIVAAANSENFAHARSAVLQAPLAVRPPPKLGNVKEMIQKIRAAGGDGWDNKNLDGEPVDGLSKRQQRMLDAAATLGTLGVECSRETVAAWIGVHPRGGSYGEDLKVLIDAGYLNGDRGSLVVTAAGRAIASPVDPAEAIQRARAGLSPRQTRIFDLVAAAYPGDTTREAVAQAMDIHARGGSFGEDIKRLVDRGLITNERGVMRARDFLFAATS
jgi:hypothetical protein